MIDNEVIDSDYSKDSVIDPSFRKDNYKKFLPERLFKFRQQKLFSSLPNVIALNKEGEPIPEVSKRIIDIMKRSNFFETTAKYLSKKSKGIGYGAITIKMVDDFKGGEIPFFQVAESIIRYNTFMETDEFIETIEKLNRGIIPLLRVKRYGVNIDVLSYRLASDFDINNYEGDDKQDIKKLLATTKEIVHNNGFVRAAVFRNRVDDEHFEYGQNDWNGFDGLLKNIDLLQNRIFNDVDKKSSYISRTIPLGATIDGSIDDDALEFDEVFSNQEGTVKEVFRTIDTEEGVDSILVPGDLALKELGELANEKIIELDQVQGVQYGYDGVGKTNDTNSKVDMVGDPAFRQAQLWALEEENFWTKLFWKVAMFDKNFPEWKKLDHLEIKPRLQDFRTKSMMMENIDKLSKYYSLKDLYIQMLDVQPDIAQALVDAKETEVKEKMISALPIMNGNLPQNIEVDFGWGKIVKPEEQQMGGKPGEEEEGGDKDGKVSPGSSDDTSKGTKKV